MGTTQFPIAISDDLSPDLKRIIAEAIQEKANIDYLKEQGLCSGDCAIGEEGSWGPPPGTGRALRRRQ